jgi:hypothetical protein
MRNGLDNSATVAPGERGSRGGLDRRVPRTRRRASGIVLFRNASVK